MQNKRKLYPNGRWFSALFHHRIRSAWMAAIRPDPQSRWKPPYQDIDSNVLSGIAPDRPNVPVTCIPAGYVEPGSALICSGIKTAAWHRWYAYNQCRQIAIMGSAAFSSCHRCKLVL